MANDNNCGLFCDLFDALGVLAQNVADTLGNVISTASGLVQSCADVCGPIVTNTANSAVQIIQSVANGISSAIAPKN